MSAAAPAHTSRTRRTQLESYPATGQRFLCLGIVVLATVVLYYQFYLAGAVAAGTEGKNGILVDYNMSFVYYVNIAVIGYILGAIASFAAGFADRFGRVTIITVGLFVVALLCLIGIPLADSKVGFGIVFVLIGLVEGVILVATPALIRDFSPQLGRASAMGFWTLGPVLGSLVVSIQISSTSNTTPWHHQYVAAGIVGLVVAALSAVFLRELSPALRDQVMVSSRDRVLVEAKAKGIDIDASMRSPFRQMLKPDIVLSAFAISVFLIIYYVAVGFFPVYFQTVFGFSQTKANSLGNWIWAFNAGALLVIGLLSDKVRVRKPFMVVGALGAIVMTIVFLSRATHPDTGYGTFVVILVLLAMFLGLAYAPWMASFTETVEKRNPALTATGLAVWGLVIRLVIAVSVFIVPHVVTTVSTLVQDGPTAQALAAKYEPQLATAAKLSPATSAALAKDPNDTTAGVKAISEITGISTGDVLTVATLAATPGATPTAEQQQLLATDGPKILAAKSSLEALGSVPKADLALLQKVQAAAKTSPKQWQHYFWIAVGGEIVFIPLIFLLVGAWSPRTARRRQEEHEAFVEQELAKLNS